MGGSAEREIRYPRQEQPIRSVIGLCFVLAIAAGLTALGLLGLFWERSAAGLFSLCLGAFALILAAREGFRFVLRAYRGRHSTWWIRACGNGFEINDRFLQPRRFDWRDIEAAVVAKKSVGEVNEITDVVGIRYRPSHPSVHAPRRRKTGADLIIRGPWGMPAVEAVAWLNSWSDAAVEY